MGIIQRGYYMQIGHITLHTDTAQCTGGYNIYRWVGWTFIQGVGIEGNDWGYHHMTGTVGVLQ